MKRNNWFFEVKNQDCAAYKFIVETSTISEPFLDSNQNLVNGC